MGKKKDVEMKKDVKVTGVLRDVSEEAGTWTKEQIINAIKCKEDSGLPCTCRALVKCTSAVNEKETVHIVKEVQGTNVMISYIGQLGEYDITREKAYSGCQNSPDKRCTLQEEYIESGKWQETYEGAELNDKEGVLNVESSYMICLYGDGILFFKDAGQMVRTYESGEVIRVKEYVTLEMLDISGKLEKLEEELKKLEEELEKLEEQEALNEDEMQKKENILKELDELKVLKNELEVFENDIGTWKFREMIGYDLLTSLPQYKGGTKVRDITQEDVDEINRVLNIYEINTPERIAHFLAQGHVETNGGFYLVEQYDGEDIFDYFVEYETTKAEELGNTQKGDGAKYRGAGIIQMTGRAAYEAFAEYIGDPKIAEDGALYVGQNYFWEAGAYFWSVYKPSSAGDDSLNLNKWCDENADVRKITDIVNGDEDDQIEKREKAYNYYIEQLNGEN